MRQRYFFVGTSTSLLRMAASSSFLESLCIHWLLYGSLEVNWVISFCGVLMRQKMHVFDI